jgi:hypothetical protein
LVRNSLTVAFNSKNGLGFLLNPLLGCASQILQTFQPVAEKTQEEQPKKPAIPTITYRPTVNVGRFTATFEFSDIRVRWNLDAIWRCIHSALTSPNIPVIVRQGGGNECRLMHWGLIPNWAQDPTIGNRMINARAESLTEKPAFKHLVGSRRCIIPADGFYEWRKQASAKFQYGFI